tara:strand:+ start:167 stop:1645 length:1479 start_codon:yes stop_codon:yes gene_type:complete
MANTIRIKRSTGSSAPGSLENAELAFAEGSKKLFVGIGTGGSGGSATTIEPIGGSGSFADLFTSRTQNTFLAAPNGSNGAATFRAMVAADVPSLAHTKISDFDAGVRTNRLDQMAAPTSSVSLNSQTITNVADPVNAQDAATKGFVEATSQGLDVKDSCVAATTGNITISTALNNGDTLDGVTLSTNDRVLVKDQSTATQNGIYIVGSSPARANDLASGADAAGMFTFVEQGTVNADNGFVCTSNKGSAVVGTNNLTFAQFSGAGQITPGNGLDKSGNTLSVDLKANGGLVIESSEIAVKLDASSITGTLAIGDGGTGATSASNARSNLGLVIGTDIEPHSNKLTELATMAQATANSLADLSATEVQILDGATVTTAQLNRVDATSSIQTQLDNKQPLDAQLTELATMSSGTASALADLTGTEVAILDGATVTTAELNILDGNTSATSTTLATGDRMVINDNGTMKQVSLANLVTFLEDESTSGFDIDGGSY